MAARGQGTILNMACLAAYAPIRYFAVSASTKAFVLPMTLAVREQLRALFARVGPLAEQERRRHGMSVDG